VEGRRNSSCIVGGAWPTIASPFGGQMCETVQFSTILFVCLGLNWKRPRKGIGFGWGWGSGLCWEGCRLDLWSPGQGGKPCSDTTVDKNQWLTFESGWFGLTILTHSLDRWRSGYKSYYNLHTPKPLIILRWLFREGEIRGGVFKFYAWLLWSAKPDLIWF